MNEVQTKLVSWSHSFNFNGFSGTDVRTISTGRARQGYDNPGYKAQISAGNCATTDFVASLSKVTVNPGEVTASGNIPSKGAHFSSSGNANGPTMPPAIAKDLTGLDRATENFVQKARNEISSTKGMTIMGELHETLSMLRHPMSALRGHASDYLGAVKKAASKYRGVPPRSFKHTIADTWLEYSYGWSPLMSDVSDILKTAKNLGAKGDIKYITSGAKVESASFQTIGSTFGSPYLPCSTSIQDKQTAKIFVYGDVKCKTSGSGFDQIKTDFGFTPEEFIPTVWELIPYSFLVDYFSNVGNALSVATFPTSSLAWTSCTETYSSSRNAVSKLVPQAGLPGSGSQSYSSELKSVHRRVAFAISVPSIRLQMPNTNRQFLNLAALFTSAHNTQRQLQRS